MAGNKKFYLLITIGLALSIIAFWLGYGPSFAEAATQRPYYQGKVITFVVPPAAGGGTDIFARTVARHFGKFIPGNPGIVIRNMPGAGETIGANYAWAAKPDGLTFLVTSGSHPMTNMLRPKGTDFKLEQMHPIFSSSVGQVYFTRPAVIRKPKDIMTAKGLIFGHESPTITTTGTFVWVKELLGFECKMVFGYGGSGPANLAFLANEITITGGTTVTYNGVIKRYVERGEVVPVFQGGLLNADGNVVKEPAAPDVPTPDMLYREVYGKAPSGNVWEVCRLMAGNGTYNKTLLLQKDTPQDIISTCRKAAIELNKDPRFLEELEKISPGAPRHVGEELVRAYPKGVTGPPELLQFMKKFLIEKYDIKFD